MPLTPKVLNTVTTCVRTAVGVITTAGGVKVVPEKLLAVTPKEAATMLVRGVTPMEAAVPPTVGTTANKDWPAPKSLSVPSRSSKYLTPGPPVTFTVATPVKVLGTATLATPNEDPLVPSPVSAEPSNWPLPAL